MGVVEFFADSWQAVSPGLQRGLGRRLEALGELAQGLESLATSGNISGQGADAMRAYIGEVHLPIVQSLMVVVSTFQTAVGVYWDGYRNVDVDGNFRLVNDEFDDHLAQLDDGMELLRGFAADLRLIASDVSGLVDLDGAGSGRVDITVDHFAQLRNIASKQQADWVSYEEYDPGFNQVKDLIAELVGIVKNVGNLTIGRGRSYQAGSFDLTSTQLRSLMVPMLKYCEENQEIAAAGWDLMFSGYIKDFEEEAERERREDALWGLLSDGLQTLGGVLIIAIGVVGTPFSAGATLAFAALGGSLIVGGVNSAINHTAIAAAGQEFNLVGMASSAACEWYDVNVMKPAADSGSWGLQFFAGVGSAIGNTVIDAAGMNLRDMGRGIQTLFTNPEAWDPVWAQATTFVDKARTGDPVTIGQIAGNILPGAAALKAAKIANALKGTSAVTASTVKSALNTTKEISQRLATELEDLSKHTKITTINTTTNVLEWIKKSDGRLPHASDELIKQLISYGTNISPERVIVITKTPGGRIVWLEKGKSRAETNNPSGLVHIIEKHGREFTQKGIPEEQIPEVLIKAINEDNIVGHQGSGETPRPIYQFEYKGKTLKLAITISSNGYIVGANFAS